MAKGKTNGYDLAAALDALIDEDGEGAQPSPLSGGTRAQGKQKAGAGGRKPVRRTVGREGTPGGLTVGTRVYIFADQDRAIREIAVRMSKSTVKSDIVRRAIDEYLAAHADELGIGEWRPERR